LKRVLKERLAACVVAFLCLCLLVPSISLAPCLAQGSVFAQGDDAEDSEKKEEGEESKESKESKESTESTVGSPRVERVYGVQGLRSKSRGAGIEANCPAQFRFPEGVRKFVCGA